MIFNQNTPQCTKLKAVLCRTTTSTKNSYAMHTMKITPNLLFEYQCTSGKFIRLPNRIESKLFFCPNWNALVHYTQRTQHMRYAARLYQPPPWRNADLRRDKTSFAGTSPTFTYPSRSIRHRKTRRSLEEHTTVVSPSVLSVSYCYIGWLGSRVVSVLDSGAKDPGSNRSRDAVG